MHLTVRQEYAGRPQPYSDAQGRYWAARLKGSRFSWESYADAWAPTKRQAIERLREKVCLWPGREVREQAVVLLCAHSRGGRRASRSVAREHLGKRVGVWTAANGTYAGKLVEVVARKGAPWRAIVLIDTLLSPASPEFGRTPRQGFRRGDEIEVGGSSVIFDPEPPSRRSYLDLVKDARRRAYERAEYAREQLDQLNDPAHSPTAWEGRARARLGTTLRIPPLWDEMLEAVQNAPRRKPRRVVRESEKEEARQKVAEGREEQKRQAEKSAAALARGPWASIASQIPGLSGVEDLRDPQGRDQAVAAKWKRLGGRPQDFSQRGPSGGFGWGHTANVYSGWVTERGAPWVWVPDERSPQGGWFIDVKGYPSYLQVED